MRSDAKASTAGSNKGRAKRKPALLLVAFAASLAALALVVGPASGSTTRFLQEVFGSAVEPSFPADRGMAVDQGTGELHVIDSTEDVLYRFNADGTPSNFSALGTNVIDGEGAEDETAHGHLGFSFNDEREQVALDESGEATDGNIYLTQSEADVVDIFNAEGKYLGQLSESTAGGVFGEPCGVAVDAAGTVYVGDRGDDMIHVFDPAANPPVNADNTASYTTLSNPCAIAAGTGATAGFIFVNQSFGSAHKLDAASGEVKYEIATSVNTVTVDPTTGHVFVAKGCCSSSAVEEYDASGASEASLVSSFKPGSTVEGIAVNGAAEEVYVARSGTEEVEVYGPNKVIPDVVTEPVSSNTGTRATLAGTVNPDGVELDECFFEWGENVPGPPVYGNLAPCAQTPAEIGAGTAPVPVSADLTGLTPHGVDDRGDPEGTGQLNPGGDYEYRLVAVNPNATIEGSTRGFSTPETVLAQAASGITPTAATLNGTVNPDGEAISECQFEYGLPQEYGEKFQKYPETAPCVPGPGGITGTAPVAVEADISGLHPGTTYHYRLKATYPSGRILSKEETVQTSGPRIAATWSEDVVFSEATLKAEIDPEGKATTYRFEYGTSEAYGSQTEELAVGSDSSVHEVTQFLEGLQPGTTYHYRAVATNADAENQGPDRTFTTYEPLAPKTDCPNQAHRYGPGANLPDCRAYEMVSPIDKGGRSIVAPPRIQGTNDRGAIDMAAVDGGRITYSSGTAFGDQPSNRNVNQYLSTRGPEGWSTTGITPPLGKVLEDIFTFNIFEFDKQFFDFTDDLSSGWLRDNNMVPLHPEAEPNFANLYRRDNLTLTSLERVITGEPLFWQETSFGGSGRYLTGGSAVQYRGRSADGSRVFFEANAQLTPDANPALNKQVYEYSGGELNLVSVLPGGAPPTANSSVGTREAGFSGGNADRGKVDRAVSADGSRVFWTQEQHFTGLGAVYVRIDGETTVPVSGSVSSGNSRFWTASSDGSKAIFTTNITGSALGLGERGDIYEFDVDSETPTLIARESWGLAGAGEDLSHLYFLSREALAPGAVEGEENLYLRKDGEARLIATLALEDVEWGGFGDRSPVVAHPYPRHHGSRVTPDGNHLAFLSERSLTGYDNADAVNGRAGSEVYLYDAAAEELRCASCNPSGARPHGKYNYPSYSSKFKEGNTETFGWWGAAWIPPWEHDNIAARALSEDGDRLFFNAHDALVPEDTNGREDVYQWEAPGTGTCDAADPRYSEANGGCLSLISTGKSSSYSELVDASADGSEVFIRTESDIHPEDPGLFDIYAASELGGYPPPPPPPPPCVGDACQDVPPAPDDPTPASAAFRGAGDPVARRNCGATAKRAMRLSRRAKRARRNARRVRSARRSKQLRRRSQGLAKRAKRLSRSAKRCRRANRRAQR